MSTGTAAQHAAARSLIEQLVANSDVKGEDRQEAVRQESGVSDETRRVAEERQAALQRRQEEQYPPGVLPTTYLSHVDEVESSLQTYGEIPSSVLESWREMFSLFDYDSTGFLRTDDLGTVLRGLGRNLTEERVAELVNAYDANGAGQLDFPTFYNLLVENAPMPGPCYEEQVMRDFAVFDTHRDGSIHTRDLVHVLRNLGEPLTRDDVDHLMQEIYIDGDGKVNIASLVQHMFRTSAPNPE